MSSFEAAQFATLPKEVQRRTMSVLRTIIGTSQEEKHLAWQALAALSVLPSAKEPLPQLLRQLGEVVLAAEILARPPSSDPVTYESGRS